MDDEEQEEAWEEDVEEEEQEDWESDLDSFGGLLEGIQANLDDTVNLSDKLLDTEEVKNLAEALRGNWSVQSLDLRSALRGIMCVEVDVAKLKVLGPALQTSAVTDLDLSDNGIGEDGMISVTTSLKGSLVRRLTLDMNWFVETGDRAAAILADSLKDIRVTDLSIRGNCIGEEGAKALSLALEGSSVGSLNLGGNCIGKEGMQALASACCRAPLRGQDPRAHALTPALLQVLCLDECQIGDDGVMPLAIALKASSLKVLDLSDNDIQDEGVAALAAGLRGSSILDLNLLGNRFGNDGAKAMAAALKDTNLERLDVSDCAPVGVEGYMALIEGARDTAVRFISSDDLEMMILTDVSETLRQLQEVLEANVARTFLLQMQVEGDDAAWTCTFRTLAGTVAAVLQWSSDRPVDDLPEAVFDAMQTSGFQLPSRHLRSYNLRILRPDGQVLDVSEDAPPLAQQLGDQKRRRLH